jgi:hypothetical protein
MEKKENKARLRLVKTNEDVVSEELKPAQEIVPPRSAFARQMTDYADDLDRMIEAILRS